MKAYVNKSHWYVYLDRERNELGAVQKGGALECALQREEDGRDLGKKVKFEFCLGARMPSVSYELPNSSFDELIRINVSITGTEYAALAREGITIFRDGIMSFQIEVTDTKELP